jgi:type I restriction enzyme, R subunit
VICERAYQHEAIRRVAEAFETGKRRALLVMATGTGKTRTTMGLIDLFLQSSWIEKVLFLADRDALVEQALNDGFKAHLPNEPRVRIRTANIDPNKRLYVATQQTMGICYERFSPGFFDLIVFDEAHRSIFNRFTEVIEYFDARMIGLTATPAAFIDRDTFRVFDCRDQTPTFLYTYEQAIKEGHLVDFTLHQAHTGFQRAGIKGAQLSEEDRNALIEQGLDPDAIDYAGTDLEVLVSNRDTLRKQWEEIMNVCIKDQGGALPGKTIIFAMTKEHASRIREVFEEMFPQYPGLLQLVYDGIERVHDGPYGDGLISKFKKEEKPRLAVSVDMLDTGIDVPEVVNLVFMKPVHSRIKLWQMIGRGTRNQKACRYFDRLPNGEKTNFLIIDFWQNDFGRQTEERVPSEMPVLTRVFNTRLDILTATLTRRDNPAYAQAISDCRAMLTRVPTDSFLVRKAWPDVESAWTDDFWSQLNLERIDFLRLKVAPLLRYVPDVDVAAETFTNKIERLALALLKGAPTPEQLSSIAEDVGRLPQEIRERSSKTKSAALALSADLAQASRAQLTEMVRELAPEMKNKRRADNSFLAIDLPDFIATAQHVIVMPNGTQVHVEEYRKRIDQRILRIADEHPALRAVREGRTPTPDQLIDLERILQNELESPEINFSDKAARAVYGLKWDNHVGFLGLLRHVLALDAIPVDLSRGGAKCGPFGSALKNGEYVARGVPVWTMENVQSNNFIEHGCLYITEEKFEKLKAYAIQDGDILISRAGTVGRMAIVRTQHKRSIMHSNLIRLALDRTKIVPEYYVALMTWFGSRIAKLKTGQDDAYTFMNTGTLGELPIPLPPMGEQKKFLLFVRRHAEFRATHVEALRQADHLFQTLLHEAFSPTGIAATEPRVSALTALAAK